MKPYYQDKQVTIYHGDCRDVMPELGADIRDGRLKPFDLIVADPPYSSGGMMRSDRNQQTSEKYVLTGTKAQRPEFSGDNRDQRAFFLWSELWMRDAIRLCRKSTVLACFTDWRQLPIVADAIQVAGYVWRNVAPWDKTEAARPTKGWIRQQCEFIVFGSVGPLPSDPNGKCSTGHFRYPVGRNKQHITEKPVELYSDLMRINKHFDHVFDPFIGGGTSLRAAKNLGKTIVGIELDEAHCETAARRCQQEELGIATEAP